MINKVGKEERAMDIFLKKWLSGVILFLTITAISSVVIFVEMRVAVAENTKDIEKLKNVTADVNELRTRQEYLINDVNKLESVLNSNRRILLEIAKEVKK